MKDEKGEKHTAGKGSNNFLHLLLEPNLQNPVCFVNYETFEVTEDEAFRPLTR